MNDYFIWNLNWTGRLLFSLATLVKTTREIWTCHLHIIFPLDPYSGFQPGVSLPPLGVWGSFYIVPVSDFPLYLRPYPLPFLHMQGVLPVWTESQHLNIPWACHPHSRNHIFCHAFLQAAYENFVLFFGTIELSSPGAVLKIPRTVKLHGQLVGNQTRTLPFLLLVRGLNSQPTIWHA